MTKLNETTITKEQAEELKKDHHYVLTKLYEAQKGIRLAHSEDYWRGALNGLEAAMDIMGVEHEAYNPLHIYE